MPALTSAASFVLAIARTLRGAWLVRPVPTIEVP